MSMLRTLMVLLGVTFAPVQAAATGSSFELAQGERIALRDQANIAAGLGNAELRQGDLKAASRDLGRAVVREKQFFATLGSERREGESSYLIGYYTLSGIAQYRLGLDPMKNWGAAHDLYHEYLPLLDKRFSRVDSLLLQHRCGAGLRLYSVLFTQEEPSVAAIVRATKENRWHDAKTGAVGMRGMPVGDYFRAIIGLCMREPKRTVDQALVAALFDYQQSSSETPDVGPLQASILRLLLR